MIKLIISSVLIFTSIFYFLSYKKRRDKNKIQFHKRLEK